MYRGLGCLLYRSFQQSGEPTAPRRGAYRPQERSLPLHRVQYDFDFFSFIRISHPIFTLPLSNSSSLPSAPTPAPVRDVAEKRQGVDSFPADHQLHSKAYEWMSYCEEEPTASSSKGKGTKKDKFSQRLGWVGLAGREERGCWNCVEMD